MSLYNFHEFGQFSWNWEIWTIFYEFEQIFVNLGNFNEFGQFLPIWAIFINLVSFGNFCKFGQFLRILSIFVLGEVLQWKPQCVGIPVDEHLAEGRYQSQGLHQTSPVRRLLFLYLFLDLIALCGYTLQMGAVVKVWFKSINDTFTWGGDSWIVHYTFAGLSWREELLRNSSWTIKGRSKWRRQRREAGKFPRQATAEFSSNTREMFLEQVNG